MLFFSIYADDVHVMRIKNIPMAKSNKDNLFDLSMTSFGFVNKIFWICVQKSIVAWVTRSERLKGAKDEVKEDRRAAN